MDLIQMITEQKRQAAQEIASWPDGKRKLLLEPTKEDSTRRPFVFTYTF